MTNQHPPQGTVASTGQKTGGKPPRATIRMEEITPEKAQKYMENMAPNTRVIKNHLAFLEDQMRKGLWIGEASGLIRFDTRGRLCDGQHRLLALIHTGTTATMPVVRNVPVEGMNVMDTGRRRRLQDFLEMRGETNPGPLAAILNVLTVYWQNGTFQRGAGGISLSAQAAFDMLDAHPGIRDTLNQAKGIRVVVGGGDGFWGAFLYTVGQIDYDDARAFADNMITGVGLAADSPILQVRNRFLSDRRALTHMGIREFSALTIKAWNLWRRGETVQTLSWRGGGANPEPYPLPQ